MAATAAIFDLDRTLVAESSTTVFIKHIAEAGISDGTDIPFLDPLVEVTQRAIKTIFNTVGESRLLMQPAKLAVRAAAGWSVVDVDAASRAAAKELADHVLPFAKLIIDDHRAAGRLLVLASTSPVAFTAPLADELGFDAVIGTKWGSDGSAYNGILDGPFVWGPDKAAAVERWADENSVDLSRSYAYSDSYFDSPLLDLVGHPTAVNPDARLAATAAIKGWPIRHFDKSDGVIKVAGREIQEWSRPLMRPELVAPYADISFEHVDKIPSDGPAIVVFNHRSYFDPTVMGLLMAKAGRNVRGLGKKEVFDVPIIGRLMRGIGGVRVERASGSDEPLRAAARALDGGEVVMLAPEGTIPRGPAFFDPALRGRWGAAKLAAQTGAPVIPVGLWGTEHVWPRSARLPNLNPLRRPEVSAVVGDPVELSRDDPDADTTAIMQAIVDLLPDEAREQRTPTVDELMRTFPPGYRGDPNAETTRRPGTDT
ncbi:HAD-IB family hydrolase [Ilumatobacter coccineus]|uniref:Putative acyltransferase n=1 Tax=Ilumatobacter coccineus (strain NBRC 103263 / KCTC 29153 / YM16-304) TaxID=1313172 RepID=A0A6C7EAD4_ILUCY|nr:HAD-IB family hydrolase [Ilumatobacter coccineus]BAN03421.1 putative acyltransferase [Ilumatobacter coccineus YM16-304]